MMKIKKIILTICIVLLCSIIIATTILKNSQKSINEIYVVTLTPANMRGEFLHGNIDGFIAWEPFNADLVLNENASYLIHSTEIWPNHPCCVLTIKDDIEEDVIEGLLWAHIKATEFIKNESNKEKILSYAKNFTGMDDDVIKEALTHINYIEFPNRKEFESYFYKLKEYNLLKKTSEELGYKNDEEFLNNFLIRSYYENIKEKIEKDSNWKPNFINKEIRLGYLTADLHQLALYVALKEEFYNIFKHVEVLNFQNGVEVMNAYRAGLLDAAYLGGAPATLKRINENIPIKIIAGANEGGSALVVKRNIQSVNDLKGKIIATPGFGTVQDLILRMIAQSAGLNVTLKK